MALLIYLHTKSSAANLGMAKTTRKVGQIIDRKNDTWLVRVPLGVDAQGKRRYHNHTIHGPRMKAVAYLAEVLLARDLKGTSVVARKVRVDELFEDVIRDYENNGKHAPWVERKFRMHLRPAFGSMEARRVTTEDVEAYKRKRLTEAEPATINRELAVLKRAFNLGKQQTPPKVSQAPVIRLLKENNVRKGFFEEADFLALRAELPEHIQPVVTFAYYTGCRRGEILALKWSQVDLERGLIRLDPGTTKNGDGRVIGLTEELFEMLTVLAHHQHSESPNCKLVFSHGGRRIGEFRGAWSKACRKVGLWNEESNTPRMLFHDFRRSGVRNLIRAGVPQHVAMKISGHKTDSVFGRYNVVDEADLLQAAVQLDAFREGRKLQKTVSPTHRTQSAETGAGAEAPNH